MDYNYPDFSRPITQREKEQREIGYKEGRETAWSLLFLACAGSFLFGYVFKMFELLGAL